jgi:multicomponent Na+:H+ antiporter subunit G
MTDLRLMMSAIFALLGAMTILAAMIGTVRLPDVFCRAHALGKGLTLGLGLLFFSLWIDLGQANTGLKIVAAVLFQFITLPVASHLLARLSLEKRLPRAGDPTIPEDRRQRGTDAPRKRGTGRVG